MSEQAVVLRALFKLCAVLLLMFSIVTSLYWGKHLVACALGILSIYMMLLAWRKIKKSIVLYLICLASVSCSLVFSYGLSEPLLVTILLFCGGMLYVYFWLVKD